VFTIIFFADNSQQSRFHSNWRETIFFLTFSKGLREWTCQWKKKWL